MHEAIRLSLEKSLQGEGGPFGAVIVRDGKIISRGWNQVLKNNDPTCHAEMVAIRKACHKLKDYSLAGCSIYVNCEPCPMCLSALYWAGIDKIYFAAGRKDAADLGFVDDFLYQELLRQPDDRKIPIKQAMRTEALAVFKQWAKLDDKIIY
ncbi:MAG: nucleoside deaminase [Proteobacteria bacterium]|nr:nucleoside deaminase [Pseudomonadota bacterium]MBU4296862.1 nucleoside deaminase [Pseudomonadota bacterium]